MSQLVCVWSYFPDVISVVIKLAGCFIDAILKRTCWAVEPYLVPEVCYSFKLDIKPTCSLASNSFVIRITSFTEDQQLFGYILRIVVERICLLSVLDMRSWTHSSIDPLVERLSDGASTGSLNRT